MKEVSVNFALTPLHLLCPGERVPGDWYDGVIPANIETAERVRIESAVSFKTFRSRLPVGLRVGKGSLLCGVKLAVGENGYIELGEDCYLAEAAFMCEERITLGNRVVIAAQVSIADSDFHPLDRALRAQDCVAIAPGESGVRPLVRTSPVILEDDVWVGFGATLLKGVHVGRGAVIGAGSVVTRSVPAGALVVGNPARVIGLAEEATNAL